MNFESEKVHPAALIVADLCEKYSHWKAKMSLSDYLLKHNVPGICGIDTRALTKRLRVTGSMQAKIVLDGDDAAKVPFYDPNLINLVAKVSITKVRCWRVCAPARRWRWERRWCVDTPPGRVQALYLRPALSSTHRIDRSAWREGHCTHTALLIHPQPLGPAAHPTVAA